MKSLAILAKDSMEFPWSFLLANAFSLSYTYYMLEKDSTIQTAYDIARSGKFIVQAVFDGERVPDTDIRRYQEDAWLTVKNIQIGVLDDAYTSMLLDGTDPEDMTADELLRYVASTTRTEYPNMRIGYIIFTD